MAKLIGTAGHVDHGKTSLIRALTGIDADRLPEEKSRGLTIDIGFAHTELPPHGRVSIVDVPGHERFLSNMLVGALGVDVALLCVAADESVKPQTREHLSILDLLPVERLVVALTRSDVTDLEAIEFARLEVKELLGETRFSDSPVLSVSALTGLGLEDLRAALSEALTLSSQKSDGPWYLPIDRVFTIKGHGAVVTGTLMRGVVKEGDAAVVEPGGLTARVRQVQTHDRQVDHGESGQRIAVNLGSVREEDLRRGMVAGAPGTVVASQVLDGKMRWNQRPKHGSRIRVSIGAEEAVGKVYLNDHDEHLAQLRLESEVAAVVGQPLILRRFSPPDLIGGGTVTIAAATPWRKGTRVTQATGDTLKESIVRFVGAHSSGVETEAVCRSTGMTAQRLGQEFEELLESGTLLGFAGLWMTAENFRASVSRLVASLESSHDLESSRLTFPREGELRKSGLPWTGKPLDRIVAHLSSSGVLRSRGNEIGLSSRAPQLKPAQRELLDRVKRALSVSGLAVPTPLEVSKELRVPVQAVQGILSLGTDSGEIVRIDESVWYTSDQIADLIHRTRTKFADASFTVSEFRDFTQTSRKYAVPLLEFLDARGVTLRRGDARIVS